MKTDSRATAVSPRTRWRAHLAIARFDHWIKNVFVIPGILLNVSVERPEDWRAFAWRLVAGFLSVGLIASSNYIINEVMDGPFDRQHPAKQFRPVPAGQVSLRWAYVQWLLFMAAGMLLALSVSSIFAWIMAALWTMGVLYNIPPFRTKDTPYMDVLSEAVNNPLRLLAGWYMARTSAPPPASLLVSYWMVGCYFMATKRYAEYREIGSRAAAYRKSFVHYNDSRLLVSILFYASFGMLTFGAFVVRYRLELVLAFPLMALVMAMYLRLAFQENSAAQHPERLYRELALMAAVLGCATLLLALLFIDIPELYRLFTPLNSGVPLRP